MAAKKVSPKIVVKDSADDGELFSFVYAYKITSQSYILTILSLARVKVVAARLHTTDPRQSCDNLIFPHCNI